MQQKEASELIGNFEVNKEENKVVVFVNPRIFPVSVVNKTASLFNNDAWISINGDPREELLVEIKPKNNKELELLGREFNNKLLEQSTNDVNIDKENPALITKIKELVKQFVSDEKGSISKQSIMTIGAILAGIGIAGVSLESVSGSHLCGCNPNCDGGGDGGGSNSCAECESGCACHCLVAGTKVKLWNNEEKPIEEIKTGDKLVGFNSINVVRGLIRPKVDKARIYGINEGEAFVTSNHPFLTKDGWKSIEPEETRKTHPNLVVNSLKPGDIAMTTDGEIEVKSITSMDGDFAEDLYNFYLSGDHTYTANNFIVHNKTCFIAGTKVRLEDGTIKNIENIKIGERMIGTNNKANTVLSLDRTVLGQRKLISFNKGPFFITPEHPIMTKDGWKSLEPEISEKENPDLKGKVGKLRIGDKFISIPKIVENNGELMVLEQEIVLSSIQEKEGKSSLILYNFILDGDHSFNANGFVVHNHTGPGPGGGTSDGGSSGGDCCGGDCGGPCFLSSEIVLTVSGPKEINKIDIGTEVISYDETRDAFTTSIVGEVIVHDGKQNRLGNFYKHPLIKLSVKINDEVCITKVTDNHPYFDPVGRAYKPLKALNIGDKIKTLEGEGVIVNKEIVIDENTPAEKHNEIVYNLHMIEGPHNYLVNKAVVHNKEIFFPWFNKKKSN